MHPMPVEHAPQPAVYRPDQTPEPNALDKTPMLTPCHALPKAVYRAEKEKIEAKNDIAQGSAELEHTSAHALHPAVYRNPETLVIVSTVTVPSCK